MVDFTSRRQFETRDPLLAVDKGLSPGIHTFQLVVTDASGNRSKAALIRVEIVRSIVPVIPGGPVTPTRPVVTDPIIDITRPPIRRFP